MSLEESFLKYRQAVTDNVGMILLLRLECPSFPETLLACNDNQNWMYNGEEYVAMPFGFKLPEDTQGTSARAQLVLDNVGRGISDYLERVMPGDQVMAWVGVANRINPLVVAKDIYLPVSNVSISGVLATADAGADSRDRQQGVKLRQYPHIVPGAFA